MLNIPVFVSHPSALNDEQKLKFEFILEELKSQHLEPRALGQSDYPSFLPLREVLTISRHCAGGIVLGFRQFQTDTGIWKQGTERERIQKEKVAFPTPWNQLESGVMYALGLPLLVFREPGVEGGIFDIGSSDLFIHELPDGDLTEEKKSGLRQVFLRWSALVVQKYHS
jgi:hypothetical protein